jgi:haloalkane dehalogenase
VDVLRTPEARFEGLCDLELGPHYVTVPAGSPDGGASGAGATTPLRMHYLDEGPRDAAEVVVCLHGEPSWGYLYRVLVRAFAAAGHRALAPDLIGFGRSDKPASRGDHTYARHVAWQRAALFDELDLRDVTLVCQDWGGLIGLRLVAEHPDRFRRVVVANTGLPTGDRPMGEAFSAWQRYSQEVPELPVSRIVRRGTVNGLTDEVAAAYDAPFPEERFKEGARQMPALVPTQPDDPAAEANRRAWAALASFDRPFLCAFSDSDPITAGGDRPFRTHVPGAAGQEHVTIAGAGHFLQEDRGPELAAAVLSFIDRTPGAQGTTLKP